MSISVPVRDFLGFVVNAAPGDPSRTAFSDLLGPGVGMMSGGTGTTTMTDGQGVSQTVNTGGFFQSTAGGASPFGGNLDQTAPAQIKTQGISTAAALTDSSGGKTITQLWSYISNTGTTSTVAFTAQATGTNVWGENLAAISLNNGAAIGTEIDFGNGSNAPGLINGTQTYAGGMTLNVVSNAGAAAGPGIIYYGAAILRYASIGANTFVNVTQIAGGALTTLTDQHAITYSTGGTATGILLAPQGAYGGTPASAGIQFGGNPAAAMSKGINFSSNGIDSAGMAINVAATVNCTAFTQFAAANFSTAVFYALGTTAGHFIRVQNGTYGTILNTIGATCTSPAITLDNGHNIQFGSTSGTKIGTLTTQMMGFYGKTPIVQPTAGAATAAATYGANEQTMLQTVYNNMRNLGLMS